MSQHRSQSLGQAGTAAPAGAADPSLQPGAAHAGEAWVYEKGLPHVDRRPLLPELRRGVLFATDLTEGSDAVARRAGELAERADVPVLVLGVVVPPQPPADDARREQQSARLADLVNIVRQAGASADARLLVGEPGRAVVRVAVASCASIIVMDRDQWHGSSKAGSVAGHLVLHAPCPVLFIRPQARPRTRLVCDVAEGAVQPLPGGQAGSLAPPTASHDPGSPPRAARYFGRQVAEASAILAFSEEA